MGHHGYRSENQSGVAAENVRRARAAHIAASCALSVVVAVNANSMQPKASAPQLLWATEPLFTSVAPARVNRDGSIIIADPGAKELYFIARGGKSTRKLGRVGSGPGEYRQPQWVLPLPGNLTILVDPSLRRLSTYSANGEYLSAKPFPNDANGLGGDISADLEGRVWFRDMPADPLRTKLVALHLLNLLTGTAESVTTVSTVPMTNMGSPFDNSQQRYFMVVPYANADGVVALPHSQALIVRASTKQMEWIDASGKIITARPLPSPAEIPVTAVQLAKVSPKDLQPYMPRKQLAFDVDFMVASEDGSVWIQRVRPDATARTEWVIVSRTAPDRAVSLPSRARLIAISAGSIIVAERTDDDVERIAVYGVRY